MNKEKVNSSIIKVSRMDPQRSREWLRSHPGFITTIASALNMCKETLDKAMESGTETQVKTCEAHYITVNALTQYIENRDLSVDELVTVTNKVSELLVDMRELNKTTWDRVGNIVEKVIAGIGIACATIIAVANEDSEID